jgi:hypothetical protein
MHYITKDTQGLAEGLTAAVAAAGQPSLLGAPHIRGHDHAQAGHA